MNKQSKRIDKLTDAIGHEVGAINSEWESVSTEDMLYKKIPKIPGNTYEDITKVSVINLPNNQVKPVNGRIFAIAQDPGEMKTEGGLILPTAYSMPEERKGLKRERLRYFVVDVAEDCNIKVPTKGPQNEDWKRNLERGDEIFPFMPQDADGWTPPIVHDFYNNQDYIVFHESELAGVGMSGLLKKEK